MPITVTCDECLESHRVRDDAVGKQFVCKGCGKSLTVEAPTNDSQEVPRVDVAESLSDAAEKTGEADFDLHRFLTETGPADLRLQRESPPKAKSVIQRIDQLIGCVLFLVASGSVVVWLPISIYRDLSPSDGLMRFVVFLLLSLIVWVMGLGGVWLNYKLFRFLIFGAETPDAMADPRAPKFSDESLTCCDSGWLGKPVRIMVDRAAGMIHFQNCHVPRGFLAVRSQVWFSCPLNNLSAVYRHCFSHRGGKVDYLKIITPHGRAALSFTATNYESLNFTLSHLQARGMRSLSTENPAVVHWCIVTTICGILVAWIMVPLRGSLESMTLYILVGAIVGAALPFVAVLLMSRKRDP